MSTNQELKQIFKTFSDEYNVLCEKSREEKIKAMAPGEALPRKGVLYGDSHDKFSDKCSELRSKAYALLDKRAAAIESEYNKPASAEAINACQLLALRKSTNRADYERMLNTYGDNAQTYETIKSIALDNGVYGLPDCPLKDKADAIEEMQRNISGTLTPHSAEVDGHANSAFLCIMNGLIDADVPEDDF